MDNMKRECGIHSSIVIENVRITPKSLIIYNPYEGQEFKVKIVLQNIGKDAVSVRILHATSSNAVLQPIISTQFLPSGLKVIREVKYKVVMATLTKTCSIPIYINSSKYLFEIIVEMKKTPLRIEPNFLNFGIVDTGPSPVRRRMTFYNDSLQATRFHVDLGPNELNIMVEPMKGFIMPRSSVDIRVDLIIHKEGVFSSEFWIISTVPTCMQLTVTARHGHIETQSRFNMKSFKFLHFPMTYYGLSSRKIILLKNASQIQSIFCITGVKQMNIFHVGDAPSFDQDYYQFRVDPKEGRLFENDVRVFTFTFNPQRKYIKPEGYFLVMMRINKVFCRDLNPDDYEETNALHESFDKEEVTTETTFGSTTNENDNFVNVMLYGTAESPSVSIIPNELVLRNLDLKVPVKRVLHLKNCSKNLPITLRYHKVAFVVVEPPQITINARQSVEVTVTITPQSYHIVKTMVQFDMLHYNQPGKKLLLQKIGEVGVPLTIHERIVTVPVKCSDIYAKDYNFPKGTPPPRKDVYQRLIKENPILGLPDDRPKVLRPWKSATVCKTIYAGLPRVCNMTNEFELTAKQIASRQEAKDYYRKFIRSYAMKRNVGKQNCNESVCGEKMLCVPPNSTNPNLVEIECANFIPLTPQQLLNISIEPRNQYIDHIAPKSSLEIGVAVQNDNGVELRIFLKPQKQQYYTLPAGSRFIVRKYESIQLTYHIFAHMIGIQNYRLDIIVNECHVFETTVTVNIVQAMLQITPTQLHFTSKDCTYKFIEFYNNLNQDIQFEWVSTGEDFNLEPVDGVVQSRNKLACLVSFDQRRVHEQPYGIYDLLIKIGGKLLTFRVIVEDTNLDFMVADRVNFGVLPVGIPSTRYLPMHNSCKQPLTFRCVLFNWVEGITVEPVEGVLPPNVVQWLKISANLTAEASFDCQLRISFGDMKTHNLTIAGMAIFPKLVVEEQLAFRKIAASGFDIKKFSLKNTSGVPALVTFDVDILSELYISENEDCKIFMKHNSQFIKPHKERCFYLHYYPSYPEIKYFPLPMSVNGITNHNKKDKDVNSLVPRLRVYTNTFQHKLLIPTWSYFFHYYDHLKNDTTSEHTINISNIPFSILKVCLRLDNVRPPFELCDLQGGKVIKKNDCALVVELSSQYDPFSFKIRFRPVEYDKYELRIPVYIKDDYNQDVHNYLYFSGTYYQPSFTLPDEVIYFGYIPLNFKIVKFIKMKLKFHRPHCFVTVDCDNSNVTLTCENNGNGERYRIIKILYYCLGVNLMDCYLNVQCTCGGFAQILMLGGAENSYLTVYNCVEYMRFKYNVDVYMVAQSSSNLESDVGKSTRNMSVSQMKLDMQQDVEYVYKSDFPFFPVGDGPFANYFQRVIEVVEAWVCQQGFFGTKQYSIPNGFCRHELCETKEKKRIVLPFCTFFCNVCSVKDELFDPLCETEETAYLSIYKFYKEVLEILHSLGGIVNTVKPESLFPYDTYVHYMKKHHNSPKIYTPERFQLWSKQSWLHLILQTYKVFVLKRLIKMNQTERHEYNLIRTIKSIHSMHSFFEYPALSCTDLYHTELYFIINWINTDYNNSKSKFTNEKFINHSELPPCHIKFFNDVFADSTILAAITLTYCPYLEEHFHTLYLPPITSQQYFYNAYLLIKVWNLLNISLHVKPSDIIECNPVMLIFLTTYLYDFLTHYKPRKEIQFSAELTKTHEVEVLIYNENKTPINYELCIFNDERHLFKVNSDKITVPQCRSIKMLVYYTARFVHSCRAVLVLKGEVSCGSKFTHGQAFVLEGHTLLGPPYIELHLQADIYSLCNKNLQFTAPYCEDCEYELFLTYKEPVDLKTLNLLPVKKLIASRTLGRMQIDSPFLVSKQRQIQKRIRLCSITLNPINIWFFARHPQIGDFYIKMECFVRPRHNVITVLLEVSKDALRNQCICNGTPNLNSNCPRIYMIKVPCKNESMWKGLLKYFFKYRDEDEHQFWNYYKDTPIGLHVLKRLLFDHQKHVTQDMSYIFEPRFHFVVKNHNKSVYMESELDIENTLSVDQTTDVLIHLNEYTSNFPFELHNQKEKRCYNVLIDIIEGLE